MRFIEISGQDDADEMAGVVAEHGVEHVGADRTDTAAYRQRALSSGSCCSLVVCPLVLRGIESFAAFIAEFAGLSLPRCWPLVRKHVDLPGLGRRLDQL